jgi:PAS domain S-box-containing protein
MFGYADNELRGRSASRLYGDPADAADRLSSQLAEASERGSANEDVTMVRRDGSTFFANAVSTAFHDDDGQLSGFSTIIRDMTSARAAAEALESAKLEAERASQAKDRFIAVLSHELRTPLVPILTGTQLLEMVPDLPEQVTSVLSMIRRNVALEARLIDDLLDVTSIERGKLTLTMHPVDVHDVLRAAIETTRGDIEAKNLRLDLMLDARNSVVNADASRLQQVFWNLIRNAVKFTPSGGVLSLSTTQHDHAVRVVVRDTGIGINESALTRIFTPFEQADPSISSDFGGLGLGLAIAFGLVQKHGGDLRAASDGPNRGAEFTVSLPTLAMVAEQVPPVPAYSPNAGTFDALRILLVEDNPDSELALRSALQACGHIVLSAVTVRDAISALDEHGFDVVVSDIGLPDGSGLDIVRHIDGRVPSIALSGFGMETDVQASKLAGFSDHLIKPVDAEQFLTAIHAAVAARTSAAGGFKE